MCAMELLVVLVVLVLAGLVLAGFAGAGVFAYGERARRNAEAHAPAFLDVAFTGQPGVVVKINMETPSTETVILGAQERGYRLTHQMSDTPDGTARTLVFARDDHVAR